MKIGLIDVDGHNFPNLPLMKISAYHKNKGDYVEFADMFTKYDIVYQSKVFTFTPDYNYTPNAEFVLKGGTGYDLKNQLSLGEIENIFPDYTLYLQYKDSAYGFLTRGCPRNCEFCIVGGKEGLKAVKVSNLDGFWNGQKEIKLLDPNLLASTEKIDLLDQLIESKSWIDFTQGLDIRLINDAVCEKIMKLKIKMLHFAWDKESDSEIIIKKLKEFKHITNIPYQKAKVYVLTNFDTSFDFDLYRIYELQNLGYDPYVMIYNKHNADTILEITAMGE